MFDMTRVVENRKESTLMRYVATWCLVLITVAAATAAAGDCPGIIGGWHRGPTSTAAVSGRTAVMGDGAYLRVVDLGAPNAPAVRSEVRLPGVARDVAFDGSHAFVATGGAGLVVVNVTDPARPRVVATTPSVHDLGRLTLQGDLVVASEAGGGTWLHVLDVAEPAAPTELARYQLPVRNGSLPPLPENLAVAGDHVVVAASDAWQAGLHVVSLATPSTPVEVAFVDVPASVVAVIDHFAFTAGWSYDKLQVLISAIDLSDPSRPVVVSQTATEGNGISARTLAAQGDYLFLFRGPVAYPPDLAVFDISTPSRPREVATLDLGLRYPDDQYALTLDFSVSHELGVAAVGSAGLQVIELSAPPRPRLAGRIAAAPPLGRFEVFGGVAYAIRNFPFFTEVLYGANPGAVEIIDLSDAAAPAPAGVLDVKANDIAIGNGHAFVTGIDDDYRSVLEVFDLRDPLAPEKVAETETPGARVVTYASGFLFTESAVFDVSDPSTPRQVSTIGSNGFALDIAVDGDRLYVLTGSPDLYTYDVSDPTHPVGVSTVYGGGDPRGLAVAGGVVFVADGGGDLRVHDGRDGSLYRKISVSGRPSAVSVHGGTLLLAEEGWGVRSFDIVDPRNPVWVEVEPVPGRVADVEMIEGKAFTSGEAGITTVDTDACSPLSTQLFVPAAAHSEGVGGSRWTTDLEIANAGDRDLLVQFRFLPRGAGSCDATFDIPYKFYPGRAQRWEDIWGLTFGGDGGGAIVIRTNDAGAALITSRTFNTDESGGTFGQGIPAVGVDQLFAFGGRARLLQLSQTARFRSNIGFLNPGAKPVELVVEFVAADGSVLGTEGLTLQPCDSAQWTRAFRRVTDREVADGWVDVWTTTEDGRFYAYGSVVDNRSNDPTTIVPRPAGGTLVPAAASAAGVGGSQWTTDLELNNIGSTMTSYRLRALPRGKDIRDAPLSEPFNLDVGTGVRYGDIWGELAGEGAGVIEVVTDTPEALLVMSRTYNTGAEGTFGQGIPGMTSQELFGPDEVARIVQLSQLPQFRSNLGFVNASEIAINLEVRFFDFYGELLGVEELTLEPLANQQWTEAFTRVTGEKVRDGYVEVSTSTPGARFFTYGSVVDNRTGDPTTILPR